MRYFLSFIAAVMALFMPLNGQSPFPLPQTSLEQTPPLPDPINLSPEWWDYFETDPDKLPERIAAFESRLNTLKDSLPDKEKEEAAVYIDRILVNLRALPEAKRKEIASPPISPGFKESYSLDELLQLAGKERSCHQECDREERDVRRQKEVVQASENYLDTRFVAYDELERGSAERFVAGLEIIASRAALEISQEALRVNEGFVENNRVGCLIAADELKSAIKRVDIASTDRALINRDIGLAEKAVEGAKDKLLMAESRLVSMVGQQDKMRSTYYLLAQKVVLSEVDLLLAEMHLLFLDVKRDLVILHTGQSIDDKRYQKAIDSWEESIEQANDTIGRTREATLRERDRLLKFIVVKGNGAPAEEAETFQQERYKAVQETLARLQLVEDEIAQAELLFPLVLKELTKHQSYLKNVASTIWQKVSEAQQPIAKWLSTSLFKVGNVPITPLEILQAIFVVMVAMWLSRLIRKAIDRVAGAHKGSELATIYVIKRLTHYITLTLGVIIALSVLGFSFQNLILILGALSVGIGFGLQNIANNFISGLIILFGRNIKVGDLIELEAGLWGRVTEVRVQNTTIHTYRGIDIMVPNAVLISNKVMNWTQKNPYQRIHIPFTVSYGVDKELVEKVVVEAIEKLPLAQERLAHHPAPQVWLEKFGQAGLDMELVVWVNILSSLGRGSIRSTFLWEIDNALRAHGISMPFPQFDLNIKEIPPGFLERGPKKKGT